MKIKFNWSSKQARRTSSFRGQPAMTFHKVQPLRKVQKIQMSKIKQQLLTVTILSSSQSSTGNSDQTD